jgi:hypothetical protein
VDRRAFISTLTGGILAASLAAEAQRAGGPPSRLGYLSNGLSSQLTGNSVTAQLLKELREGFGELGYHEGRTLAIEYRVAEGRVDRLPALAAELVRLRVEEIVEHFTRVDEPDEPAESLSRPGAIEYAGARCSVRRGARVDETAAVGLLVRWRYVPLSRRDPLPPAIGTRGHRGRHRLSGLIAQRSVGIDGAGLRIEQRPLLSEGRQGSQQDEYERESELGHMGLRRTSWPPS